MNSLQNSSLHEKNILKTKTSKEYVKKAKKQLSWGYVQNKD